MTEWHDPDAPFPMRFADAERINPYQLLLDLHRHALEHSLSPTRDQALGELALAAAVVSRWNQWQLGGHRRDRPGHR